jgi:hypothetical protein
MRHFASGEDLLLGGKGFPGVNEAIQAVASPCLDQRMDVIWHHAPRDQ